MKFRRDDGDLIPVWVLDVVNVLLQFLNAHDANGLVPLVAALKIVRNERDVHVVLSQLAGRFALAVPHERDHGAAVPVAAVNCLKTPEEAEGMLADGVADMAILGRQLICDPEWANKAKAGREDGLVKSRIGDTTAKAAYDGWYQSVYVPAVETAGTEG